MAVALPPPQVPQQALIEQLRGNQETATAVFQNYRIHISGDLQLPEDIINRSIGGADTISNAVRNLASAAYLSGYPAAQVLYALSGTDLYVMVSTGRISAVHADFPMSKYFNVLEDAEPLTASEFERRRMLASIHADRAGVESATRFQPDGSGATILEARNTGKAEPTTLRVEFSNPGNRFVGRNFLDLDISTSSHWGDEVHLLWREGLNGLNSSGDGSRYHEPSIAWNRVTPFGVIGAGIHYVNYDFEFNTIGLHGDLRQIEALWLVPLYADFTHRWTLQAKVDRTDKKNEREDTGAIQQQEVYTSVEASTSWSQKLHLLQNESSLDAGLAVRRGLSDEHQTNTSANLNYLVYKPALGLKHPWTEHFNTSLNVNGQFTTDILPEQQEWLLGGLGSMTAYLPGVAVGDVGYVARAQAELNLDVSGFEVTPRLFGEYGFATFQNPAAGQVSERQSLGDVGVEVAFKLGKTFEGSVAWAKSVYDEGISQSELDAAKANVYFRIAAKI